MHEHALHVKCTIATMFHVSDKGHSVVLFVGLSVCLSLCLSVCLSVRPSVRPSVCLSVCPCLLFLWLSLSLSLSFFRQGYSRGLPLDRALQAPPTGAGRVERKHSQPRQVLHGRERRIT